MSCVLNIAGKHLDIDSFILKSKLQGFEKKYNNQSLKSKSKSRGQQYSYVSKTISEAGLDNFKKQVADVIKYLKKNKKKLLSISETEEIEFATVNFMIQSKSVSDKYFAQYIYLPKELTILCGDLKLGIEVAIV
jgi:hypothetical protein